MLSLLLLFCSSSVIGFDLGTTNIKAAVFRSGRSIEIVLNELSKRKTPALVSFEPGIPINIENVRKLNRRVGVSAIPMLSRNSSTVIRSITSVIGKKLTPELQKYLSDNYIDFVMNETQVNGIEPEIVLAMLFEQYVQHAKTQLQQDNIQEAVVAVPGYFTDFQKKKVSDAIKLAGLKLIKIIDEKTALSLQYAIAKHETFVSKPKTVAIIDFGSSSLMMSAVKFYTKVNPKARGNNKNIPIIEDLVYHWTNIGGIDFDVHIAEYLKKKYNLPEVNQVLLQDAEKIKHALSLAEDVNVSCDSLGRKIVFTENDFNQSCKDLFDQFENQIKQFISKTKVEFDAVEVVGGNVRIKIIQRMINNLFQKEPGRGLNGDEAIASGATFTATTHAGGFKTSDFIHNYLYPYNLTIVIGNRTIPFVPKKKLEKQTVRLDPMNDTEISIEYDGELPPGSDRVIGKWQFDKIECEGEVRIVFNLALSKSLRIKLANVIVATKVGDKVEKKQLQIRRVYPEKANKAKFEENKRLLSAFTANDIRLAKIAEARNSYESTLFTARENLASDETWKHVVTESERQKLTDHISSAVKWIESGAQVETSDEIVARRNELDSIILPIIDRASEYKLMQPSIEKLESAIKDVNTTVNKVWPLQSLAPTKVLKRALMESVDEALECIDEVKQARISTKPWDDQPYSVKDVELKTRKLLDLFETVKGSVKPVADQDDDDEL